MATRRLFNRRKLCIAITHLHRDLMNSPYLFGGGQNVCRYNCEYPSSNAHSNITTVWSAAGSRPETQRRLEGFFGTEGEIRSKKSISRCTVFTFKKTRISAGKRGRGTLISVFNGAVRRPFNGTAGYEYSGQSHPGGPCAAPRKAESGTTQGPHAI